MTLTYELDPDNVNLNQRAKYLRQMSFRSKMSNKPTDTRKYSRPTAIHGLQSSR